MYTIDPKPLLESFKVYHEKSADVRHDMATANNCISIGEDSSFAYMVAVPENNPDVVIKVCDDNFILYAKACFKGKLVGPHFLKVYDIKKLRKGLYAIAMERLPRACSSEGKGTKKDIKWYNEVFDNTYDNYDHIVKHPSSYSSEEVSLAKDMKKLGKWVYKQTTKKGKSIFIDHHDGNVMRRADGTGVFIDPIA